MTEIGPRRYMNPGIFVDSLVSQGLTLDDINKQFPGLLEAKELEKVNRKKQSRMQNRLKRERHAANGAAEHTGTRTAAEWLEVIKAEQNRRATEWVHKARKEAAEGIRLRRP